MEPMWCWCGGGELSHQRYKFGRPVNHWDSTTKYIHCKGNSVYIFLFWELRGLSPNAEMPKIGSKYSQKRASVPISTFMCLWAIYIFPGSVHIFPPAETAAPSWEYIIRSQTHECGNWDWGPFFSGNICFQFSAFFLCSVYQSTTMYVRSSELGLSHPPVSHQRVCPSPRSQRGGHTRLRVRGWGCPNSDD